MTIGFVTSEFTKNGKVYPGGLANYLFNTCSELVKNGHEVIVFLLGEKRNESYYNRIKVLEIPNFPHRYKKAIKILFFNRIDSFVDRLFGSLAVYLFLRKYSKKKNIDVLQYTNWKGIGAFKIRTPSILRISSYEPLWDNNPQHTTIDKRLCIWLEAYAIKKFNYIIGPGQYINKIIENNLSLKKPINLIPSPLPVWNKVSAEHKGNKEKTVVYLGTISLLKGAELLFNIVRQYLSEHNDTRFILVGKPGKVGTRHASDYIEEFTHKYPDNFNYYTNHDRGDVRNLLLKATVVLIPSLIDNFPNVALEAMQMGVPVIASKTSSLDSLITHGHNGYIMDNRNPEEWIKQIRNILFQQDEDEKCRIKINISNSLQMHTPENATKILIEAYKIAITTGK